MKIFYKVLTFVSVILFATVAFGQTKVVVIPMAGDDLKPLANIITVAKQNGDFDNPLDALNSITGSGFSNPYLVVIAPGSYTVNAPLEVPAYVHLTGSGSNQTSITVSGGSNVLDETAALITLNSRSQLSSLGVRIISTNAHAIGVYAMPSSQAKVSDVAISLSSAGSLNTVGIYDDEGDMLIENSSLNITSTSATNRIYTGLQIYRSSTRANNINVRVGSTSGGAMTAVLVESLNRETPNIINSDLVARQNGGGSVNGVINQSTSRALTLRHSQVLANATSSPEIALDGELIVISSLIRGPLGPNSSGNTKCVGSGSATQSSFLSSNSLEALDIDCST